VPSHGPLACALSCPCYVVNQVADGQVVLVPNRGCKAEDYQNALGKIAIVEIGTPNATEIPSCEYASRSSLGSAGGHPVI
jgi:hypothetical protein